MFVRHFLGGSFTGGGLGTWGGKLTPPTSTSYKGGSSALKQGGEDCLQENVTWENTQWSCVIGLVGRMPGVRPRKKKKKKKKKRSRITIKSWVYSKNEGKTPHGPHQPPHKNKKNPFMGRGAQEVLHKKKKKIHCLQGWGTSAGENMLQRRKRSQKGPRRKKGVVETRKKNGGREKTLEGGATASKNGNHIGTKNTFWGIYGGGRGAATRVAPQHAQKKEMTKMGKHAWQASKPPKKIQTP